MVAPVGAPRAPFALRFDGPGRRLCYHPPALASLPEVTLVTRRGCCLCQEARTVLETVRRDIPFRLVVRDLDAEPDLPASWSEHLPVVLVEGRKRFKVHVSERRLRRLLHRAAPGPGVNEG